jgi:hypothetical protein
MRGECKDLPWKTSCLFLQALNKIYDKIKPLSSSASTGYQLEKFASRRCWSAMFEDGTIGNEYCFEWDGIGLDESSIKETT